MPPQIDFIRNLFGGSLPIVENANVSQDSSISIWIDASGFDADVGPQLASSRAPQDTDRPSQGNKLKEGGDANYRGDLVAERPAREPTIAPFLWSLGSVCFGFCLTLWGLLQLDNERCLFGAALLGCGLLLGGAGFLLMALPL